MEVAITDITEVEKEISVSTTPQELAPHFEEAYRRQIPKLEIKGFRKGKAPLDMVKKPHGEAIEYGALDTIASEFYRQIITEREIHTIGEPVLTDIDYKRGSGLSFKIKYEIKPVVHLQQYKGVPVERTVHQVTDEDVEHEILHLQQSNSTLEEVRTATSVEHVVTADVQQLDELGTPLIGKKNADMKIYLAGGTVYKQIRDALVNGSTGESRRVKFESEREGAKVLNHVEVRLKKIERVVLPEVNEEFVKKLTKEKVTSVVDFRTGLRSDIEQYKGAGREGVRRFPYQRNCPPARVYRS
jgi:trigger factor